MRSWEVTDFLCYAKLGFAWDVLANPAQYNIEQSLFLVCIPIYHLFCLENFSYL